MTGNENTYNKYLIENDQFFYDERNTSKVSFIKQDSELYDEETAAVSGSSVRVKKVDSDWVVFVNGVESLVLKGTRFTAKERDWLHTATGFQFLIEGVKKGWSSVSEFKRQLKDKLEVQ